MHSHALIFIQDLAIIMLISGIITVLSHKFRQPIVFGYILAGVIIGPYTPQIIFISDPEIIKTLAELGIIFLLFSLGLEFDLKKITTVGLTAFVAAFAEIVLMMLLGYEIGLLFGWTQITALFLGAMLAISSTTIIVKALDELGLKEKGFAQLIFGILIIEDVFAILILAILTTLAISGTVAIHDIVITATKLTTFLVVSLFFGILFIPRIISYVAKFHSNEMLLISVLGLCFGFCFLVIKLQYSVALGAFVIGAIIAESKQLKQIETLINPIRDMFSAIFFVSVGLLFDPNVFIEYFIPIIVITIAVVVGKVATCSLGVLLSGRDGKTALQVGMGLAQIGEFSFIIAGMGIEKGVAGKFIYSIAVSVSIITTILTPYLIKYSATVSEKSTNLIPRFVSQGYHRYSHFMHHLRPAEDHLKIAKHFKAATLQLLLNFFIVLGIFLSAAFLGSSEVGDEIINVSSEALQQTIIWSIAFVLSLPSLYTLHQSLKSMSIDLIKLNDKNEFHLSKKMRNVITGFTPIILLTGMMLIICGLTANILPPFGILIFVLFIVAIILLLLSSFFLRFYDYLKHRIIKLLKKR